MSLKTPNRAVSVVMARQPACATKSGQCCLQASDNNRHCQHRELQIDGEI